MSPSSFDYACGAVGGVIALITARVISGGAAAEHAYSPHTHLASINSPAESEDFCVRSFDGNVSHTTAFNELLERLFNQADFARDWDRIRNVDIVPLWGECPLDFNDIFQELQYEIRFYIKADVQNECGNPPFDVEGCADRKRHITDPQAPHEPKEEWHIYNLWIESDNLYGGSTVNHEVGHALGLRDGGPELPTPTPTSVPTPTPTATPTWWGQCTGSIMHSYGCDEPEWPTAADIASVESLTPAGSGEWHNWNFQGKTF